MPVYYRNRETGLIEAKYVGCDTQSSRFRDKSLYERIESQDPNLSTWSFKKKPWWRFWDKTEGTWFEK